MVCLSVDSCTDRLKVSKGESHTLRSTAALRSTVSVASKINEFGMTPVIHSQQSVNQHLFELAVAGLSSSSELSSVIKMFLLINQFSEQLLICAVLHFLNGKKGNFCLLYLSDVKMTAQLLW